MTRAAAAAALFLATPWAAAQTAPMGAEAWWKAGTLAYQAGKSAECRDAFRKFVALEPKAAQGFGYLGICEYQLKELPAALAHLQKAADLGLAEEDSLAEAVWYHAALLYTKSGQFERAMPLLKRLALKGAESPDVIALAGLTTLQRPIFPADIAPEDRGVVFKMGRAALLAGAGHADDARGALQEILEEYPSTPGVHYGYASLLLAGEPDACAIQLKKELEISTDHIPSLIALAMIQKQNEAWDDALAYLARALRAAPGNSRALYVRGTIYLAMGRTEDARKDLEAVAKAAPASAETHAALASVYYRLRRKEDGDRERAIVVKLKAGQVDGRTEP